GWAARHPGHEPASSTSAASRSAMVVLPTPSGPLSRTAWGRVPSRTARSSRATTGMLPTISGQAIPELSPLPRLPVPDLVEAPAEPGHVVHGHALDAVDHPVGG